MNIIDLRNVIKRYDGTLAVDNLSLEIEEGEIFGLLGPNGAGKSTTIKMIMGLLKPNGGEIFVDGLNIREREKCLMAKRVMGVVPQEFAIYSNMSAIDNVMFFGSLYGLRGKKLREKSEEALEFTGLKDRMSDKPKKFSGGMKRRLNIACAIMHQPKIIILDEPTVGIDPQSRNHILESVKELNRRGSTIIYTSHYMEEVEDICHRAGIIDHGKLIALGTKNELKKMAAEDEKLVLMTNSPSYSSLDAIKKINGVKKVSFKEGAIEVLASNGQEVLQDVLFSFAKNNVKVKSFSLAEPDLESLFLSITGRNLRD